MEALAALTWQQGLAVALIGFMGTFCYAVAAFGRAIVVHMVYNLLVMFIALRSVGPQEDFIYVVSLIAMQGLFVIPFLWPLRNDLLWRPFAMLSVGGAIGAGLGSVLLVVGPVWIIRDTLAMVFLVFGVYKIFEEVRNAWADEFKLKHGGAMPGTMAYRFYGFMAVKTPPSYNMDHFKSWSGMPWSLILLTIFAGATGGLLVGISGVGGPPLITWTVQVQLDKNALRAIAGFILAVMQLASAVILFGVQQQFNLSYWPEYVLLLLATMAGLYLGNWVHDKVDVVTIVRALLVFLILAAVSLFGPPPIVNYIVLGIVFLVVLIMILYRYVLRRRAAVLETELKLKEKDENDEKDEKGVDPEEVVALVGDETSTSERNVTLQLSESDDG